MKKFLGAVHSIGSDTSSHLKPYLIKFANGTLVYLFHTTHYAYPIRLANTVLPDLKSYQHQYDKLMRDASEVAATDVCRFINRQKTPPATPTDLDLLTVFVANYICESNRNWVQLLVSLIQLGGKKQKTTFETKKKDKEDKKDKKGDTFPMGGGGWKNACTWGGRANPNKVGGKAEDGDDIKRWLLALLIDITGKVAAGPKQTVLGKEDWVAWFEHEIGNRNSASSKVLNQIGSLLEKAAAKIKSIS